ncbi:uncharacterized protein Z518_03479 [Rhinocladiella mackenziei CBS 650.93]|uniref:Rhinocladiella mackenziei CBS 650.93 unplaced genomic scaffold supercont1.2, whole genome shotgun sequence n=1 Tax=Rhinocladiella mackenziei CBS 650.93 TaxID=1442369 RepID=A0A0D2G2P4_9EURO|nr:uncharacterized protein Z518_03479 [Rhinocladiella mackenziei CBS 650.93]KIX08822.1 hypothetical protein Z518_03479 [Rhinocladiella mackenziei CBS 650.93]
MRGECPAKLAAVTGGLPDDVDAQVYIAAVKIKRYVDGLMDARYALNRRHLFMLTGSTRVGVKLVDALTPFNAVHPKLDRRVWEYGFVKNALFPEEARSLKVDGSGGKEFIDLLENKIIDDVVPDFLGDDALLFSYTANIARPGNSPTHMHTDQITIRPPLGSVAASMNWMYFLDDVGE